MKRCYFCKGKLVKQKINHVHSWGEHIILFKGTPAEVCKQCGETYLKPNVIEAFDKAIANISKIRDTVQIPVVLFPKLART